MSDEKTGMPDLNDANQIMNYGAQAQQRVAEFSDLALENLRTKDLGEVGTKISELIARLQPPEEGKNRVERFFRRAGSGGERLIDRYRKACAGVDRIAGGLCSYRDVLMKDIEMLELLYEMNREQYEELSGYLTRGREALEAYRNGTAAEKRRRAEETGDPLDAQAARDAAERCERFEKKLHDLELTRSVALQTAPQIRLLQNNDALMAEKIQSSVVNTIPLWKSQMVLALGTEHSRAAADLQQAVSEITNGLLRRNAAVLKETTLAVTAQAEAASVSVDALKEVNALLIETMEEVLQLRAEGQNRRKETERELRQLEETVKRKLRG